MWKKSSSMKILIESRRKLSQHLLSMSIQPNVEICKIIRPCEGNIYGKLHGGANLKIMEEAGYIAVMNHLTSKGESFKCPILARLEEVSFLAPASVGDYVCAKANIVSASLHSVLVKVHVNILELNSKQIKIAECQFFYINAEPCRVKRCFDLKKIPIHDHSDNHNSISADHAEFFGDWVKNCDAAQITGKSEKKTYFNHIADHLNIKPYTPYFRTFPTRVIAGNVDCNHAGIMCGGFLLNHMDEAAAVIASTFSNSYMVTAGIDSVELLYPVFAGDVCVICPWVVYTSNKSIHIKINVFLCDVNDESKLVATGFYTFVAIDEKGRPKEIPQLICQNKQEEQMFEERRHKSQLRKSKNSEIP